MRVRAGRVATFALAVGAVATAGCRRSPVEKPIVDAATDGSNGAPSAGRDGPGMAAETAFDAWLEHPANEASPGDAAAETSGADTRADGTSQDATSDLITADATGDVSAGDAPVDAGEHDAHADMTERDTPPDGVTPADRASSDGGDARPEDQPCGPLALVCSPFACDVARGVCKAACMTNDDCVTGKMCNAVGLCGFKEDVVCTSSDECLSGHCAQGVCCSTACTGPCRSCALPGSLGTCATVLPGALDPFGSCGEGGTCNRFGGCVPGTCATDTDCGDLYWCNNARCVPCNATCASSADCTVGATCVMRNFCTYCDVLRDAAAD
jgi:hypothetical protein